MDAAAAAAQPQPQPQSCLSSAPPLQRACGGLRPASSAESTDTGSGDFEAALCSLAWEDLWAEAAL